MVLVWQGQSYLDNGEEERNARGEKIERVYHCPDCEKSFTREEHLKRHCRIHTDDPVHRCEVAGCTKSYTRKERLTRHYKVCVGPYPSHLVARFKLENTARARIYIQDCCIKYFCA